MARPGNILRRVACVFISNEEERELIVRREKNEKEERGGLKTVEAKREMGAPSIDRGCSARLDRG